ncbi:hypothetical protein [Streptomyces rhizosphaerihabitans]|uniref:hypothetical protein n=1 Tax=Streptomyces rhizosphaerihabitans TaxID=1266770 RepID=UPI0021BED6B3|nr:hypothetical protein [Streptomyces rhizosphaerihabitans]MCT9009685.1 hypothetical protein [Streptomyces rhizosphaerihabitans]
MSFPLPSRTPSGPRRRTLLAAAAGAFALAGCSAPEPSSDTTGGSPSAADRARARGARDSATLADRYTAVIAAHPDLAGRLGPLRAEVVRHVQAFGGGSAGASASPSSPSSAASPSESSSGSPSTSSSGSSAASASASAGVSPGAAARPKDALADLAAAELALADERTQALVEVPGELARLLASVAAAGAAHAFLLTKAAK